MKPLRNILLVAIAVLAATGPARAEDAITLRYKVGEEDQLLYRTVATMDQTVTATVNGKEQKYGTTLKNDDISLRTLEKVDKKGNFRIKTENKRLYLKMKVQPVGEYEFDSQSTEHDTSSLLGGALTPLYERLNGAFFTFTLSPRGELISLEGYKELVADVLKGNPIAAQFGGGGSDKAAKMGMADQHVVFPEKPVKPGDTWETTYELEIPKLGKAEGKKTYTFEGYDKLGDRKTVRIGVVHELSFDLDIANTSGTLSIDDSSGTIQFDPERGQLLSMKNRFSLSGNLTVKVGDKSFPINTKQTQTVLIERLEKLPE